MNKYKTEFKAFVYTSKYGLCNIIITRNTGNKLGNIDADNYIRNKATTKAKSIYGSTLPSEVSERLNTELEIIFKHRFSSAYTLSHFIAKYLRDNGQYVASRGFVGSSFVAFLLGMTNVNPLLPHYRCQNCECTEFIYNNSVNCGYDLPHKSCPNCGKKLISDGHDIPFKDFEDFMVPNSKKPPEIKLNYPISFKNELVQYLYDMLGQNQVQIRVGNSISKDAIKEQNGIIDSDCKIDLIGVNTQDEMALLKKYTGVSPEDADIKDPKIFELFTDSRSIGIDLDEPASLGLPEFGTDFVRNIVKQIKPSSFYELLKISDFVHGTKFEYNNFKDILSNDFKSGFPASHSVEFVRSALIIGWYKVHYPLEFYAAHFNIYYSNVYFFPDDKAENALQLIPNFEELKDFDEMGIAIFKEYAKRGFVFEMNEKTSDTSERYSVSDNLILVNH